MSEKKSVSKTSWTDPDDAPELTEAWFEKADLHDGETLVRRGGRPRKAAPKQAVNIRLDPDVVALPRWRPWLAVADERGAAQGRRPGIRGRRSGPAPCLVQPP